MGKKKKMKIAIISSIVAVILIASGLITCLLLLKNDNNKKLKALLANVSTQIFATYDDLAENYNSETAAQAVCYSGPSNINFSVMASPVAETIANDDVWNLTQGAETFQDYLDNINNVMAHYAIAEYLVTENEKSVDLTKAYHFKSSTVEYYATANYAEDKFFSFTIKNDNEKIRVRVNIQENGNLGESIEFFKEAKIEGNKYYYQYSILNFKTSNYAEVSLVAKNIFGGVFDKNWLDSNVEEHNEHEINHKDKNSFVGKKYQRNAETFDGTNPTTQKIFDKVNRYKDKLFGNFDGDNNNKKDIEDFPNAQGMQDYAFNKYVAKLSLDEDGKEFLEIVRTYQWVGMDVVLANHNFNENTNIFRWVYKSGVEVINQKINCRLISLNDRSCDVENFGINSTLIFKCKIKDNYYNATFSKNSQYINDRDVFLVNNFEGLCSEKHSLKRDGSDIDYVYCDCNKLQLIKDNNKNLLALHENAQMNDYRIGAFDMIASHYSNLMQELTIPALKYNQEPDKNNIKIEVANENYTKLTSKIVELIGCANFDYYLDSNYFEKSVIVGLNKPFAISKQYQNVADYEELQLIVAKLFGFSNIDSLKEESDYLAAAYGENAIGVSTVSVANRLKYDGTIYTTSNIFVLPFMIETSSNNGYSYGFSVFLFVNDGQVSALISDIETACSVINYRKTTATDSDLKLQIYGRCSLFETMSNNILSWEYQDGYEIISQTFEFFHNAKSEKQTIDKSLKSVSLDDYPDIKESSSIYFSIICIKNSQFYHSGISIKARNKTTEIIEKDISFSITTQSGTETIMVNAFEIVGIEYYNYNAYYNFSETFDNGLTQINLSNYPNGTLKITYKNFDGTFTKIYEVVDNADVENPNVFAIKYGDNKRNIVLPFNASIESIQYKRTGETMDDIFSVKPHMFFTEFSDGIEVEKTQRTIEFSESGTYLLIIKFTIQKASIARMVGYEINCGL